MSLANTSGQHERAARLFGSAERMANLTRNFHSPAEWAKYAESIEQARLALGDQQFEQLKAEGKLLAMEQAAALMEV